MCLAHSAANLHPEHPSIPDASCFVRLVGAGSLSSTLESTHKCMEHLYMMSAQGRFGLALADSRQRRDYDFKQLQLRYGTDLQWPVLHNNLDAGSLSYSCPPHLCASLLRPGLLGHVLALVAIAVAGHVVAPWLRWLLSICHGYISVGSRLCASLQS